jgi:hypothetical protein
MVSGQWSVGSVIRPGFDGAPWPGHGPLFSTGMSLALAGEQVVGPRTLTLAFARGGCAVSGSSGRIGSAIPIRRRIGNSPHIPVVVKRHSDKKEFPVIAQRQAIATRAETFPPSGRSFSRTGVSSGKACDARNPQPCALTTRATHGPEKGCFRSRLVTVTGISTRTRVLRRVALVVRISICAITGFALALTY